MFIKENDPLLHRPSKPVTEEQLKNSEEQLKPTASLLINTIFKNNALGVSACQVGIDMAMFAMMIDSNPKICINPQIVAASFNMEMAEEGCLSYPGLRLKVRRPDALVARYTTLDGQEVTEQLDGLAARVWLHEYDHTIGVCFIDRVGKLSVQMAKKKKAKNEKRNSK